MEQPLIDLDPYPEGPPPSKETAIPRWLIWTYILLPIWGIVTLFLFWDGSWGWLDRGYWQELQQAADTTSKHIEKTNG